MTVYQFFKYRSREYDKKGEYKKLNRVLRTRRGKRRLRFGNVEHGVEIFRDIVCYNAAPPCKTAAREKQQYQLAGYLRISGYEACLFQFIPEHQEKYQCRSRV